MEWIVFYHKGKELAAHTVKGTFPGEREAVIELLAGEKGIPPEEIQVVLEER